jgi:L-rhamnose isomerase/sugar isomerase
MQRKFEIDDGFIAEQNSKLESWIEEDYEHLAKVLRRGQIDIEDLVAKAQSFRVAVPSWGLGTGGTRFARFPGLGEPRDIYEKLEDCAALLKLVRSTP